MVKLTPEECFGEPSELTTAADGCQIHHGDAIAIQSAFAPDLFDAVITDPPYGLKFMGHQWDHGVPGPAFWKASLRVAKPGAFLVAFGGTRTYHRLTCAIEDAGWEIRDCLCWLYGQGFPKNSGALKPGWEPIVLARRPGPKAPLQIDACRIDVTARLVGRERDGDFSMSAGDPRDGKGRWPANVVLDEEVAEAIDTASGILKSGNVTKTYSRTRESSVALGVKGRNLDPSKVIADTGGASRFFYCAKAPRAERTHGGTIENKHPTVKPVSLMRWLARLIAPAGGRVLDPFCGSGSTGVACGAEGFDFVGIDSDAASVDIARRRTA